MVIVINGIVFIVVGLLVAGVSRLHPVAADKFVLFFYVGLAMAAYGAVQLLWLRPRRVVMHRPGSHHQRIHPSHQFHSPHQSPHYPQHRAVYQHPHHTQHHPAQQHHAPAGFSQSQYDYPQKGHTMSSLSSQQHAAYQRQYAYWQAHHAQQMQQQRRHRHR